MLRYHTPLSDGTLIKSSSAPAREREPGIGPDRDLHDIVPLAVLGSCGETFRKSEFIIAILRRRMTAPATLALENLLAAFGRTIKFIRIWRWLERVQIECEGVKLIIGIAGNRGRRRSFARPRIRPGDESVITRKIIYSLIQSGVAHDVGNTPVRL